MTPTRHGGGGTSDYDQLANKPKINNHELTGNKTAAQLGLATPSDIPDVLGKLPLHPLPKYLHFLPFDDTYPADAAWLYAQIGPSDIGRCSAVRRGGKLWRNYDWTFDDAAEFVVKVYSSSSRFGSVGVASVGSRLTENDVMSAVNSRYYKCLPGMTLDGINEKGVVCEINVDGGPKTGWHGDADDDGIHILAAVRWVLDNGETAAQAAEWIADHIIAPQGEMNFHFMVADATSTYIVENGKYALVASGDVPVLTNFRVIKQDEDDPPIYAPEDAWETFHAGSGYERYELLRDGNPITDVWFTNAYKSGNTWDSDFESAAQHAEAIRQWAEQGTDKEEHRGKTTSSGKAWWQSVHTTEYDFAAKTMKVAVQEVDDWYTFAVDAAAQSIEIDDTVTRASANLVKSSGIWSAVWGALTALPTGFSSLYDWCVSKFAEKRGLDDLAVYAETENLDWTWESDNAELIAELNALPASIRFPVWIDGTWEFEHSTENWELAGGTVIHGDRNALALGTIFIRIDDVTITAEAICRRAPATKIAPTGDHLAKESQIPTNAEKAEWNDKQSKITASGILKGNGSGDVSAAMKSSTAQDPASADYRDPKDNTCHKTDYSEWVLVGGEDADTTAKYRIEEDGDYLNLYDDNKGGVLVGIGGVNPAHPTEVDTWEAERDWLDIKFTRSAVCTKDKKFVTSDVVDGKVSSAVSTNNPAFVSAVRNTPTSGMPDDMPTDWGTYGTVGAALAALAAFVKWAKSKIVAVIGDDGKPTDTFANDLLGKPVAIQKIDERLPIPISTKSDGFTTESYKRFVVTVSGAMTVTLHKPTGTDAEVFECRFDGSGLSADASITFAKVAAFGSAAAITTMDTNCGTVTKGKVALMSAFWNGATWDMNWKVEG